MFTLDESAMHDRWDALCARVGAFQSSHEADLTFEMLATMYTNPPRIYHDLAHIAWCLERFDEVQGLADHTDAVEFALWLHDCVFIAERPDNEARSADAAGMIAGLLGCAPAFVQEVRGLILATRHDQTRSGASDAALVSDVDLSILGGTPEEYDAYRAAIRAEFDFASDDAFNQGRIAFLYRMLDRDHIYATPFFRSEREYAARRNLSAELDLLEQHDM
ncbi:MAG: N-methyl-D-aspartate receptor NMDAR2C subunit [Planctomycetota bacterium]